MNKSLDDPRIASELSEMLDSISKIKSPEYGMIVRTVFNIHNLVTFQSHLLKETGRISDKSLEEIYIQNDHAMADLSLSLFRLYHKACPDLVAKQLQLAEELEADLMMLLNKQAEYCGK
jgi:hypothetical protein